MSPSQSFSPVRSRKAVPDPQQGQSARELDTGQPAGSVRSQLPQHSLLEECLPKEMLGPVLRLRLASSSVRVGGVFFLASCRGGSELSKLVPGGHLSLSV